MKRLANLLRLNLAELHFCKADKVKYRKHLTAGVSFATAVGFVGTANGDVLLVNLAALVNFLFTLFWIWE